MAIGDASNVENIDISFESRYIESYRMGRLNIDFFRYSVTPNFCSSWSHIFTDSKAGSKEFSYDRSQID